MGYINLDNISEYEIQRACEEFMLSEGCSKTKDWTPTGRGAYESHWKYTKENGRKHTARVFLHADHDYTSQIFPCAVIYKGGQKSKWSFLEWARANGDYSPKGATPEEIEADRKRREESAAKEREQKAKSRENWLAKYNAAPQANPTHPYLVKKRVGVVDGVKQCKYHNDSYIPSDVDALMIPILDAASRNMTGVQLIFSEWVTEIDRETGDTINELNKKHIYGSQLKNVLSVIRENKDADTIFICEGYATGFSVAEVTAATNSSVFIAFDCHNLPQTYQTLRAQNPNARIIIAADNDKANESKNQGVNKGIDAAQQCTGAYITTPPNPYATGRATGGKILTDWNDLVNYWTDESLKGYMEYPSRDELARANARATAEQEYKRKATERAAQMMSEQLKNQKPVPPKEQPTPQADAATNSATQTDGKPTTPTTAQNNTTPPVDKDLWGFFDFEELGETPTEWLINGIFPRIGTAAIVAPRGSGKSWLIIDAAMSIACGLPEWHGRAIKTYGENDTVVYICGEGASNIKTRLNIWREYNKGQETNQKPKFKVTKHIPRFNTETRPVLSRELYVYNIKPCLIILDTLSCFFDGDENKTVDMNSFTHEMTMLAQECKCCVIAIHHTGHAAENQNRERGSGALSSNADVFSVLDTCNYNNGLAYTLTQTKNRYAPKEENGITLKVEKVESALYCRQDGKPETALIPVSVIENTPRTGSDEPQPTRKQKRWLEYIAAACKTIKNDGKNPFTDTRYDFAHVALSDVEEIAKAHSLKYKSDDAFKALDDLEENGFIAYNKHGKDAEGKDTVFIEILHRATIIELNGKEAPQPTAAQESKGNGDAQLSKEALIEQVKRGRAKYGRG